MACMRAACISPSVGCRAGTLLTARGIWVSCSACVRLKALCMRWSKHGLLGPCGGTAFSGFPWCLGSFWRNWAIPMHTCNVSALSDIFWHLKAAASCSCASSHECKSSCVRVSATLAQDVCCNRMVPIEKGQSHALSSTIHPYHGCITGVSNYAPSLLPAVSCKDLLASVSLLAARGNAD